MARSRRSLQRTGNVTSIAEARQKREEKRQAEDTSSPNNQERRASTPSKETGLAQEPDTAKAAKPAKTTKPKKKVGNRTYNKEKVEALKAAIAAGTYKINARRTADKFIERESPA